MTADNPAARVDLDALAGLLSGAGVPWSLEPDEGGVTEIEGRGQVIATADDLDAALIVAAVNALPDLLVEVGYARARVAKCSRCGERDVLNPRPYDDIVVCEPCMHEFLRDAEAERDEARAEARETLLTIRRYAEAQAITHRAQFGFDGRQWLDVLAILDRAALADRVAS